MGNISFLFHIESYFCHEMVASIQLKFCVQYFFNKVCNTPKLATQLTHYGRVTHVCVSKPTIIASDNGLSPGWCQAVIWTSDGILLIGPLGTNFSEISIEIITFSFKKMHLQVSSSKCCLSLNVLNCTLQFMAIKATRHDCSHIILLGSPHCQVHCWMGLWNIECSLCILNNLDIFCKINLVYNSHFGSAIDAGFLVPVPQTFLG